MNFMFTQGGQCGYPAGSNSSPQTGEAKGTYVFGLEPECLEKDE
jgi:hypothetical protein